MKKLRYIWKYYIRPVLLGIDPNSLEGLSLHADKLREKEKKQK